MQAENKNTNFEEVVKNEQSNEIFGENTTGEIDLGDDSEETGFDPFADFTQDKGAIQNAEVSESEETFQKVVNEAEESTDTIVSTAKKEIQNPVEPKDAISDESLANPFEAAMADAETKKAEDNKAGLIGKLPVFEYANVKEDIVDTSKTFEDIREEKASDFPELEDEKRVSWTMVYGKITKNIAEPKTTTIAKMKSEIELSKEFLDSLKKSKGEVVCKITPKVTAQKKGEISSYKGFFTDLNAAEKSGKPIIIIPAYDGNVYEIRNNDIGRFVAKAKKVSGLSEIKAGFTPALPPLPLELMNQVISFFRHFMNEDAETEALANVYWDKIDKKYYIYPPKQIVTKVLVKTELNDIDNERFIHVMDIHSHNSMEAKFSPTDNADEKATRIYMVIGRLDKFYPEISVRVSVGGSFVNIDPAIVIDGFNTEFPNSWIEQVEIKKAKGVDYL